MALTQGVCLLDRAGALPGGGRRWVRVNHRGDEVTLVEGVALAIGTAAPLALVEPASAAAVLLAAGGGAVDDLAGDTGVKGLRGHLGALRQGRVTTGALKVGVLVGAGVLAAWEVDRDRGRGASTLAAAGVVAGAANLANLLDLRPGRALKVALLVGLPLARTQPAAAACSGAALAVLPDDLGGRSMLGDTGANAVGAALGVAAVRHLPPRARWPWLSVLAGLTLVSERVSFTRVIDATPGLRQLDRWGRR
ncbi:hypothetical protein AVL62_03090 [Serinicoccus chungangensis]|uniref:Glycosyl transferase family 4 n=1 Tax=Serinicoccus chungangensis TaxID=767452 RepID=A0A0W8I7Q4_9MICO|nr:hypothetical protein [Serinicoccus chungangensis]KUG54479.1 hypothetical protein AVL62_03090 [Serinicoccus chungangensis]